MPGIAQKGFPSPFRLLYLQLLLLDLHVQAEQGYGVYLLCACGRVHAALDRALAAIVDGLDQGSRIDLPHLRRVSFLSRAGGAFTRRDGVRTAADRGSQGAGEGEGAAEELGASAVWSCAICRSPRSCSQSKWQRESRASSIQARRRGEPFEDPAVRIPQTSHSGQGPASQAQLHVGHA